MTLIRYTPNRKGTVDIRTLRDGKMGKRGEIVKRRGKFKAVLTRDVSLAELRAISGFVAHENGEV